VTINYWFTYNQIADVMLTLSFTNTHSQLTILVQDRPFSVAKAVKNHWPPSWWGGAGCSSLRTHSRLGFWPRPSGVRLQPFALLQLPWLCPENDLLRNFSVLVVCCRLTLTLTITHRHICRIGWQIHNGT